MNFKVVSELILKNVSDMSGVLVFVCFSAKVIHFHPSLYPVLKKISECTFLNKSEVDYLLVELSSEEKKVFWNSLVDNHIILPSE